MSIRNLHVLILVSVAYVAAQMVADISNLRNLTLFGVWRQRVFPSLIR